MNNKPNNSGWIEVICGNMFSGKTEELIRRLRRAEIARLSVATVSYTHLTLPTNREV